MDQLHRGEALAAARLTGRERVVLSQIVDGVTLQVVASRLFVSRNTVKSQLRSAYRKIGVSSRAEAIAWVRAQSGRPIDPRDRSLLPAPRAVTPTSRT